MRALRWGVVLLAVGLALAATLLVLRSGTPPAPTPRLRSDAPSMDDIDEQSRAEMRRLLREAGREDGSD